MSNVITQYGNNVSVSITNNPLAIGNTTITVLDVSLYPTITGPEYFYATLSDINNQLPPEVVKVLSTDLGTNSMVVERGVDDTAEATWPANSNLQMRDNKLIFEELRDHNHTLDYAPIIHGHQAFDITYDNSTSGQASANVQEAIDTNDEQIALRETAATGVLSGGVLSTVDVNHIAITSGVGEIVDAYTDRTEPIRTKNTWVADPNFLVNMPDNIGQQVIYVDSAGNILQKADRLTDSERRSFVQLGSVYYRDGTIETIIPEPILSNSVSHMLFDFMAYTNLAAKTNGAEVKPVTGVMSVWVESGEVFSPGINSAIDIKSPNVFQLPQLGNDTTPISFDVIFEDGTTYLSNQTVIPEFYEASPGNALAINGNDATIHYIYRTAGSNYLLQLGQTKYATGSFARDGVLTDRTTYRPFVGAGVTILSAQIYLENSSANFDNAAFAGIVGLIGGASASPGGGISVNEYIQLTDVVDTTYAGNAGKLPQVNLAETGLEFTGDFVNKTTAEIIAGQKTFTDDVILDRTSSQLRIKSTDDTLSDIYFVNAANLLRTLLRYEHGSERFSIRTYNASGSLTNSFWFEERGLLTLPNKVPEAESAIRKDFADNTYAPVVHTHASLSIIGLSDADDLNDITTIGQYDWSSTSPVNHPLGGSGLDNFKSMEVVREGGQVGQIVSGGSGNNAIHAMRRNDQGVWKPWEYFAKQSYVDDASAWGNISGDITTQIDLQDQFTETRNFAVAMALALGG